MSGLFNLRRPEGNNISRGGGIINELIAISADDILHIPEAENDVITEDIRLKNGRKMSFIYATEKSIEIQCTYKEGDNKDCYAYENSVSLFHPGINQIVASWINKNSQFKGLLIIRKRNNIGVIENIVLGSLNDWMYFAGNEGKIGNEVSTSTGNKLSFKGETPNYMCFYEGAIDLEEDIILPGGITDIDATADRRYVLSSSTEQSVVITSITGLKHGELVTLVGSSGENPAILEADEIFTLKNGAKWIAKQGSSITLKAFDVGGEFKFLEQSRY